MKQIEISCDFCGRQLKYSRGGYDYILHLSNRKIGPEGSSVLDYLSYPCIENDADFCGLGCLKEWLKNDMKPRDKKDE